MLGCKSGVFLGFLQVGAFAAKAAPTFLVAYSEERLSKMLRLVTVSSNDETEDAANTPIWHEQEQERLISSQ